MPPYTKPALTPQQLVVILQERGLTINDTEKAARYIQNIGYYRLSAYFKPFYATENVFSPGSNFDSVLSLYIFDRKLRLLALDPVQRIEVAIRTAISNYMATQYSNPFWFLDHRYFNNFSGYHKTLGLALKHAGKDSAGLSSACKHYYKNYGDHPLPPSWMLIEELPMGCWSKLYANLKENKDKREIANLFGFNFLDFISWLQSITTIRNTIAHHRRFWNTEPILKPKRVAKYAIDCGEVRGAYQNFVIIMHMLKTFTHRSTWGTKLAEHIELCPLDVCTHMQFPINWKELKFWRGHA